MLANLLSPIFQFRRNIPLLIKDQEKPGIITKYIDDQQVEIQLFDEKQTCIIISDPQFIISELKEYPEDEKIQKKIEEAKKYKYVIAGDIFQTITRIGDVVHTSIVKYIIVSISPVGEVEYGIYNEDSKSISKRKIDLFLYNELLVHRDGSKFNINLENPIHSLIPSRISDDEACKTLSSIIDTVNQEFRRQIAQIDEIPFVSPKIRKSEKRAHKQIDSEYEEKLNNAFQQFSSTSSSVIDLTEENLSHKKLKTDDWEATQIIDENILDDDDE